MTWRKNCLAFSHRHLQKNEEYFSASWSLHTLQPSHQTQASCRQSVELGPWKQLGRLFVICLSFCGFKGVLTVAVLKSLALVDSRSSLCQWMRDSWVRTRKAWVGIMVGTTATPTQCPGWGKQDFQDYQEHAQIMITMFQIQGEGCII